MARPEIAVHVLSTASELVLTPPANTWRIDIISKNDLVLSASDGIKMEVGSETTGYHFLYIDDTFDIGGTDTTMPVSHDSATTIGFKTSVFGLKQAIPTTMYTAAMGTAQPDPFIGAGMHEDATAWSTLRIFAPGGATMTGTIYVVYHKKTKVQIQSHDCGASPGTEIAFTELGKKNNHIIVSADLTTSGSSIPILQVSPDGSTYDTGATEYSVAAQNAGLAFRSNASNGVSVGINGTAHQFFAHLSSTKPPNAPSSLMNVNTLQGSAPQRITGRRNANQLDKAVRIVGNGGETFNAGTVYMLSFP